MFNRDLSTWKIPTSILWAQYIVGVGGYVSLHDNGKSKLIRNSLNDPKLVPKFNQVLCSKQWVDFWNHLDEPNNVNDLEYDQTWLDYWNKTEDITDGLLDSMAPFAALGLRGFDETPKINFFYGTGGTILCCGKGEKLVPSTSIPSQAKCVGCDVGQYQDQLYTKPEKCNTCPLGYAAMTATEPCSMCAAGEYMDDAPDERTAFGCKTCLPGMFCFCLKDHVFLFGSRCDTLRLHFTDFYCFIIFFLLAFSLSFFLFFFFYFFFFFFSVFQVRRQQKKKHNSTYFFVLLLDDRGSLINFLFIYHFSFLHFLSR